MSGLVIRKPFYTDEDMTEMFGFSKRKMRELRVNGVIDYCNTRPIRYTIRMVEEFLSKVDNNPNIISSAFFKK